MAPSTRGEAQAQGAVDRGEVAAEIDRRAEREQPADERRALGRVEEGRPAAQHAVDVHGGDRAAGGGRNRQPGDRGEVAAQVDHAAVDDHRHDAARLSAGPAHREAPVLVDLGGDEVGTQDLAGRRAGEIEVAAVDTQRRHRRGRVLQHAPAVVGIPAPERPGRPIDRGQVAAGHAGFAQWTRRHQAAGGELQRLHDQRRRIPRVEAAGGDRQRGDAVAIAAGDALEVAAQVEPLAVGGQRGERRHERRARRIGGPLGEDRRLPGGVDRAGAAHERRRCRHRLPVHRAGGEEHPSPDDLEVGQRRHDWVGPAVAGRQRRQVVGLERVVGRRPGPEHRGAAQPGARAGPGPVLRRRAASATWSAPACSD